jgi:hypothetical protein
MVGEILNLLSKEICRNLQETARPTCPQNWQNALPNAQPTGTKRVLSHKMLCGRPDCKLRAKSDSGSRESPSII